MLKYRLCAENSISMPLLHDEDLIKRIYDLKREHPDWGVRRIGQAGGVSKDTVHRILRRIDKGDIVITEGGDVIDRSEPRGIVAYQKMAEEVQINGTAPHPDHGMPVARPATDSQQNFMNFGGIAEEISRGLEKFREWASKGLEDMLRFGGKCLSRPGIVEPIMDFAVVGTAAIVCKELSKKEYRERGIDLSGPARIGKEICDKYRQRKEQSEKG
jgi:hypothetical protein